MRIAFIHPRYPSSEGTGAAHSATQIVNGLVADHDVSVYCARSPPEEMQPTQYDLYELTGNSRHPHTDTRLNKEVRARKEELQKYDIVHSYLMRLIPSIAAVGKDSGVKTIVTLNAYGGTCARNDLLYKGQEDCQCKSIGKCVNCIVQSKANNSVYSYLYALASRGFSLRLIIKGENQLEYIDGYQALSPHMKDRYSSFEYKLNKINIIPNILDTQFDIEHKSDFKERFRFLYVGSLRKSKGADRLIGVFNRISEQSKKDVSLTIIGDGKLKSKIQQQVKQANLSSTVNVEGKVPYNELPNVYARHDIFLYPGRWDEPFGRVFLEAMAAGTPIVSTDVGSVSGIIGNSGIVTKRSKSALADAAISMLDPQELRKYSKAGKERANYYKSSNIVPQFETMYQEIL